ncbi:hypothetical protein ACFRCR_13305 [Oerskovia sp. NPDC056781]|uniref:hypothetical protein n=1 Tax=Oerskovia sp. NPDC056781 TaxID=3345942 RepID=UPI00366B2868
MPISLTGWERRIRTFAGDHGIDLGRSKTQRLALRIQRRAEQMQHVDPDDLLRSVLGYRDPTGEAAVRNVLRDEAPDAGLHQLDPSPGHDTEEDR